MSFQLHHSFLVLYIQHTPFCFSALACDAVPFAQNISSSSVACYRPLILSKFQFKCCIFREVFLESPVISSSDNIVYHPKIFPSNKHVRDHISRIQNCTPGPTTELSGWAINLYSMSQQMKESNFGHKRKNEKTGFILHMNKNQLCTVDHLHFGSITMA